MDKKYNCVFEGGGVKGLAHIGAFNALETANYKFYKFAGSSAGAIIAALLAAGYNTSEITEEIISMNFEEFIQRDYNFPLIRGVIALDKHYGLNNTEYFEKWLERLLKQKNVKTFKDLKDESGEYKLKIVAADISNQKMLILPESLMDYGLIPDDFSVAKAVTMSISIPIFFRPVKLIDNKGKECLIVDGGLYANYPTFVFEKEKVATLGFRFFTEQETVSDSKNSFIKYLKLLINAVIGTQYVGEILKDSEILISTELLGRNIKATDFDISLKEKMELIKNGYIAGEKFVNSSKKEQ